IRILRDSPLNTAKLPSSRCIGQVAAIARVGWSSRSPSSNDRLGRRRRGRMAARFSKNWPPIDCLASHRLPPLKSEGARDEGVQYEAESAQTAEHRGISALVSSEPLLSATGPYAEVAIQQLATRR